MEDGGGSDEITRGVELVDTSDAEGEGEAEDIDHGQEPQATEKKRTKSRQRLVLRPNWALNSKHTLNKGEAKNDGMPACFHQIERNTIEPLSIYGNVHNT